LRIFLGFCQLARSHRKLPWSISDNDWEVFKIKQSISTINFIKLRKIFQNPNKSHLWLHNWNRQLSNYHYHRNICWIYKVMSKVFKSSWMNKWFIIRTISNLSFSQYNFFGEKFMPLLDLIPIINLTITRI
jgi:hypothetical protein